MFAALHSRYYSAFQVTCVLGLFFLLSCCWMGCSTTSGNNNNNATNSNSVNNNAPGNNNNSTSQDAVALYSKYCALCHGEDGKGYKADNANALSNPEFLAIASDAFLRAGIIQGRPGTSMSAWGKEYGGPLSSEDVDKLVKLIRSWQTKDSVDVDSMKIDGVAKRGEVLYEFKCAECHGKKGEGGSYMSLNSPVFLNTVSDGFLWYSIAKGRPGTVMPGFEKTLTPQGIKDIVKLIRSWQKGVTQPKPVPERTYKPLIINEGGPEPGFKAEGRFVAADLVKAERDKGAAMIMVDARPPSDYITMHIDGAISVPFYDVSKHKDKFKKDVWIVAYCACPHAESGIVYDFLKKEGYTKIKVLDEGYNYWRDKKYPLKEGPNP